MPEKNTFIICYLYQKKNKKRRVKASSLLKAIVKAKKNLPAQAIIDCAFDEKNTDISLGRIRTRRR